jgi:adenylate cyclase
MGQCARGDAARRQGVVDVLWTLDTTIRGVETTIVQVSEPGRTPLYLQLHRPLEVGRDCDGVLLTDALLSRRHLRVSSVAGRVTLEDLGSTNGTLIDGVPVQQPTALLPGQSATFGACHLELVSPVVRAEPGVDDVRRTSIDLVAAAAGADRAPMVQTGSGTLTIVFSDIEGSTRRAEQLGDEAWMELLNFHNRLVRRQVERAGGYEVKAQGDGFMLAFPSARSAILCSMEIMRALEVHGRSRPNDALRVRIGMHTGEAIEEDGDLFGKPVVLAARIANQANGGEILVSSLVREIVESRGDLTFGASREVELKGLVGRHLLHPLMWSDPMTETRVAREDASWP